jgi:hypothetical protein
VTLGGIGLQMRALLEQLHLLSGGHVKPEDLMKTSGEMHGLSDSQMMNDDAGKSSQLRLRSSRWRGDSYLELQTIAPARRCWKILR